MTTNRHFKDVNEGLTLHEALQFHLSHCLECQEVVEHGKPRRSGQKSQLCPEYQEIIAEYAEFNALESGIQPTVRHTLSGEPLRKQPED